MTTLAANETTARESKPMATTRAVPAWPSATRAMLLGTAASPNSKRGLLDNGGELPSSFLLPEKML